MVYKRGTPEYDLWRERISVANKGKKHSEETKQKISAANRGERHPMYGKHHSAETLAKMRVAQSDERNPMYGKHHSVEARAKMGRPMNGERNPMYGKHHSIKTREKIGAAQVGKCRSAETRAKISMTMTGERNHMYGKHHDAETRAKIGRPMMGERNPFYGKHHSVETRTRQSAAHKNRSYLLGSNNPNWRGDISFEPYPVGWTEHFRETIRKRDNYTCVLCGDIQSGRQHDVHHINYIKADLREENLITLCTTCHRRTNCDREYWKNLFEMVYAPEFPKERMMKNESES